MMGPWMYGTGNGISWVWMGLGMVINLLFWVAVIYVAYRLFRGIPLGGGIDEHRFQVFNKGENSAEEILRKRYANGEIDREQYREMMEELKK